MEDYLKSLNDEQKKAVINTEGPCMVIAGAGSGKTRVLTYRVAHLIYKGIDPFNILSLTFTNKAAREMKERISQILGNTKGLNLWMGTFHSVFARILRSEAELIGYPSNFTIYDTDDSKSLIKTILKEEGLDDKIYKPGFVLNRISAAKNNLISPGQYQNNTQIQSEDQGMVKPKLGLIYEKYSRRCKRSGAMDFDDILYNMNVLLRDHGEALYKYQDKFKYILVDEYQDTNYSQYLIIKKLAARHENICVVGDDAQSIYAFRGANIRNILNFEKDYPDLKTFKLEQNYRSTQTIVDLANGVISNNKDQIRKTVWTQNGEGNKVRIIKALTDSEEGAMVANSIFHTKMNEHSSNKDFAILYRTNAQSRSMEEALRKLNVPYKIYGGLSFYKRKEIKDLLAYFRIITNQRDEEALKRIINYPARGIGNTTVDKVIIAANESDVSLWDVITNPNNHNLKINAGTYNKIQGFTTLIKRFSLEAKKLSAYDIASQVAAESGLLKELHEDKTPEGISRHENIQELLNGIKDFTDDIKDDGQIKTLDLFMEDVALLTDDDKNNDVDEDHVSLMTIHAAKGLEFPHVFIVGMEENLFPSQLSLNSRADLEEERRLFYVAITRAKHSATLSYAINRYRWGNLITSEPSRFLEELDEKYLSAERPVSKPSNLPVDTESVSKPKIITNPAGRRNFVKVNTASSNSEEFNDDSSALEAGMQVKHQRFGSGKVLKVEGNSPNKKATIFFKGIGQKQLLLKFAKLKVIG